MNSLPRGHVTLTDLHISTCREATVIKLRELVQLLEISAQDTSPCVLWMSLGPRSCDFDKFSCFQLCISYSHQIWPAATHKIILEICFALFVV